MTMRTNHVRYEKGPVDPADYYPFVKVGQVLILQPYKRDDPAVRAVVCYKSPRTEPELADLYETILWDGSYKKESYWAGSRVSPQDTENGVQVRWTVTDEFVGQDVIDELVAGHRSVVAQERAEADRIFNEHKARYDGDYDAILAELRAANPWAISAEVEPDEKARVATNLKAELKAVYPKTQFYFSGLKRSYQDISVRWYLPGPSLDQFRELTAKYENPHSYEYGGRYAAMYDESPVGQAHRTVFGRAVKHIGADPYGRTKEEVKAMREEHAKRYGKA